MENNNLFEIKILDLHWIKNVDDGNDLCAHGHVELRIGNEIISNYESGDWTLSSTALSLLRSTKENYDKDDYSNQLLPCCGHFFIADEKEETVIIQGCDNGIDWKINHIDNQNIQHILENGNEIIINKDLYKEIVYKFADEVENFYNQSKPRNIPSDEFDRKGYLTFWKEWKNLREK
ncbi:hypothetical protein HKT18_13140 [Flavobacterium sp. IMCC34852]|uniref:Uncharacterized protein n=1 Tax=Flavobacterium rivulicola TaxID=2732161 RepID=A0A7Y3RAX2_9FLAO|nr:hypothetical protein [Flavobacterium sp. IMCC34852]